MPNRDKSNGTNNSNPIAPSTIVDQEIRYKRLSHRSMMLAQFSDEPEMFSVQISGEKFGDSVDVSDVYDEYHPLMALGRAIVMFQNDYTVATIKNIRVFKRVIVPVKPKKNR